MDCTENTPAVIHAVLSEWDKTMFCYVSDLHLEQQLLCAGKPALAVRELIDRKVKEMVSSAEDTSCPLLVAGDTGDSYEMSLMLYETLLSCWQGDIFAVLGNHELWDVGYFPDRPVDEIIAGYKAFAAEHTRFHILENELIIKKSDYKWLIISEKQLLDMDPTAFWKLYGLSSYMILGGIGFSGMNPVSNAQTGTYRGKLTADEDANRSSRFSKIHERLRLCAGAFRAVILTHTPPQDWCGGSLCPNWIYVCGHNHRNNFECPKNGPVILNDNQMGFVPRKWELKAFWFDAYHQYDPLEYLPDGIHHISAEEYINYLRSSGIGIQSFSRKGTILAVKHDGIFLFLLEGKKLYLLNGGSIYVAEHPLSYYDEHLTRYFSQVKKAFILYDIEKKRIGRLIRKLGGRGTDHGCIIDIDFWNHIYCNPRDGKISFYYATDTVNKVFYQDFLQLVRESPSLMCREQIMQYLEAGRENIPALMPAVYESALLSVAPEAVRDTSMYSPSRRMRSVQYALENKVIRFWKDEILNYDFETGGNPKLDESKKALADDK